MGTKHLTGALMMSAVSGRLDSDPSPPCPTLAPSFEPRDHDVSIFLPAVPCRSVCVDAALHHPVWAKEAARNPPKSTSRPFPQCRKASWTRWHSSCMRTPIFSPSMTSSLRRQHQNHQGRRTSREHEVLQPWPEVNIVDDMPTCVVDVALRNLSRAKVKSASQRTPTPRPTSSSLTTTCRCG